MVKKQPHPRAGGDLRKKVLMEATETQATKTQTTQTQAPEMHMSGCTNDQFQQTEKYFCKLKCTQMYPNYKVFQNLCQMFILNTFQKSQTYTQTWAPLTNYTQIFEMKIQMILV